MKEEAFFRSKFETTGTRGEINGEKHVKLYFVNYTIQLRKESFLFLAVLSFLYFLPRNQCFETWVEAKVSISFSPVEGAESSPAIRLADGWKEDLKFRLKLCNFLFMFFARKQENRK